MTEFERQFQEVKELLHFNDFNQTIKRVIDFTLDMKPIGTKRHLFYFQL